MQNLLLMACLASTWFMVGLIWFVQVVHYPLLAGVGNEAFQDYHRIHVRRTTWVVLWPMLVELIGAVGLLINPPTQMGRTLPGIGLMAAVGCWISTACLQVPFHERLSRNRDPSVISLLVRTNLIRTVGWTIHGLVLLVMAVGN